MRVVVLQRRLIEALCALPAAAVVDLAWLQGVWSDLDAQWVRRFWENDTGKRNGWIKGIAAASVPDKKTVLDVAAEQMRFTELWAAAPTHRVRQQNWNVEPFKSVKNLLVSFYAPLFYDKEGYQFGTIEFSKSDFITAFPKSGRKVCPYCDNFLQTPELDHFLPKDDFPFLSCHPDNLIPSCHDSNSFSHKGTTVPLEWGLADQAADWFHPRWRTARGAFTVAIVENPGRSLTAALNPASPAVADRVTNLDTTFKLAGFWSEQVEDELQLIGSQVSDSLYEDNIAPTEAAVRAKLQELARLKGLEIGKRGLAICHHALYEFAANTSAVVTDITRSCLRDKAKRDATRNP
jgi:hypothetical protein